MSFLPGFPAAIAHTEGYPLIASFRLSVVIAVQHAGANVPAVLVALDPAAHPEVEFLFCGAGADAEWTRPLAGFENVRSMAGTAGQLVPQLWAEGIRAASGDKVALTTAQCVPEHDWVERLASHDLAGLAGCGGAIANDPAARPRDWAMYLLRYFSYAPPVRAGLVAEIAADNALYRRADILEHADLLEKGFWEPSFHARFRADGKGLALDPALVVVHRNRYTGRQFFRQRRDHGRAFGLARAEQVPPWKRMLLITLSPLLPLLFLSKIARSVASRREYRRQFLTSLPWLLYFLTAWGWGEVQGYIAAGRARKMAGGPGMSENQP